MGTDSEERPLRLSVKIRVIRGQSVFQQAAMSLLGRRSRRGGHACIDLLEIADGMLLAGADEEDDGNQNECRPGFHEAKQATGEGPDCNPSFSPVDAAGRGRLVDDDLAQAGTAGGETLPEPCGHVFDRGIFEALDFVEAGVIEKSEQRLDSLADGCVVVNPAKVRIDLALDGNLDLEAVSVHPAARVAGRDVGQGLGGFEGEVLT